MQRWHHGETAVPIPGGESLDDVVARYVPAIDDIVSRYLVGPDGRDVYVVSHGAAIRLVAARLAQLEPEFAARNYLLNTGSVELRVHPGAEQPWTAHRWGEHVAPFTANGAGPADDDESVVDPMELGPRDRRPVIPSRCGGATRRRCRSGGRPRGSR